MNPRILVLLVAAAALGAKLYCASTTVGTCDVAFFYKFAGFIHRHGLLAMYRETDFFNHTPLVGWFSHAIYELARGDQRSFALLLRLPAIFADFLAVLALLWLRQTTGRPAWWAIVLFAASPVAFMISGYHGNVDSLIGLGVLAAAVACTKDRPALCGVFLGLACNIKIIPALIAPLFLFYWWQRGRHVRFALPAAALVLVGWAYPLLHIPGIFLRNVLGYSSVWGVWGVTYALRLTDLAPLRSITFADTTPTQAAIMQGLKVIIVVSVLMLAWRRRRVAPLETFQSLALIWTIFFVFAPGFGGQYLAWLAPCVLLASERWYAALTAASSIALFVFYTVISKGLPWDTGFSVHSTAAGWVGWFVLPWLVLVAYLASHVKLPAPKAAPDAAPSLA